MEVKETDTKFNEWKQLHLPNILPKEEEIKLPPQKQNSTVKSKRETTKVPTLPFVIEDVDQLASPERKAYIDEIEELKFENSQLKAQLDD